MNKIISADNQNYTWVQVEGNISRQVQNGLIYVRYLDEENNIQYKEISEQAPKAKAKEIQNG